MSSLGPFAIGRIPRLYLEPHRRPRVPVEATAADSSHTEDNFETEFQQALSGMDSSTTQHPLLTADEVRECITGIAQGIAEQRPDKSALNFELTEPKDPQEPIQIKFSNKNDAQEVIAKLKEKAFFMSAHSMLPFKGTLKLQTGQFRGMLPFLSETPRVKSRTIVFGYAQP